LYHDFRHAGGHRAPFGRRASLSRHGFFWAFGVFIVSCAFTHFQEILTEWKPGYWLSAATQVVTALASIGTTAILVVAAADIVNVRRAARLWATRRGDAKFRAVINASPLAVPSFRLPETQLPGGAAFLPKPFSFAALLQVLRSLEASH
jgi:hypothetical protein